MTKGIQLVAGADLPVGRLAYGEDCNGARVAGSWEAFVQREHEARHKRLPNLDKLQCQGEVVACVSGGKWTVVCPFCGDHIYASKELPFLCVMCGNVDNQLRPMKVVFPVWRRVIEKVLLARRQKNRNWLAGETVWDLVKENRAHGLDAI